jgi:hypothetical protein
VEYGAPGFIPGTGGAAGGGTIVTGVASPVGLSGLNGSTNYDVYVRQVCAGPVYSANSGVVTFNTLCTNQTLPGTQGFNTAGSVTFPTCWSQQYVAGTNNITFQTSTVDPPTTPFEGSRFVYWNSFNFGAGDETRLVSRAINTTGSPNVFVYFRWYNENNPSLNSGTYLNEGVQVQYSLDAFTWIDAGVFIPRHDGSLSPGTGAWKLKTIALPAGAGNKASIYVGIKFHSEFGDNCSLDALTISNSATLPAGLLSFSGYKDGSRNQLRWTTSAELSNSRFEVQRSTDGVNYSSLGFVNSLASGGNSTSQLNYAFTDNNVNGSKQYYRLRQVDFDNHSKLSNIVLIKGDKPVTLMIDGLFPNPANSLVNVMIAAPNKDYVTLVITDIAGRTVIQLLLNVETGSNTIPVDISRLTNGTYMVKLICSSNCESAVGKFVKQ